MARACQRTSQAGKVGFAARPGRADPRAARGMTYSSPLLLEPTGISRLPRPRQTAKQIHNRSVRHQLGPVTSPPKHLGGLGTVEAKNNRSKRRKADAQHL